MHTHRRIALGAALLLLTGAASAQGVTSSWYFGIGAGAADWSDNIPEQIHAAYAGNKTFDVLSAGTTKNSDSVGQIFAGYRFMPWLGAEVAYQDLGTSRTFYSLLSHQPIFNAVPILLHGEYRARDVNAALVASWPIGENFELLARGGIADTRFNYDEHGNDAGGHPYAFHARTLTRANALVGVGGAWNFAAHFALRLDLDRSFGIGKKFALNPEGNGRFDHIDAYTLNLVWKL
jgi:hypothetical protein